MTNYELKAKVMEIGLDKVQRQISWSLYVQNQIDKAIALNDIETLETLEQFKIPFNNESIDIMKKCYDDDLWQEAYKVNNASYKRTMRLKKRILNMLVSGNCLFLTLTFTNQVLESTSKETRRKYVARYLKQFSDKYVANIDYGKKKEREHYHAVIMCDMVKHDLWLYGAINFERVRYNEEIQKDTTTKLSKYVNKLTNHAIKETTQRNYLIYSRSI